MAFVVCLAIPIIGYTQSSGVDVKLQVVDETSTGSSGEGGGVLTSFNGSNNGFEIGLGIVEFDSDSITIPWTASEALFVEIQLANSGQTNFRVIQINDDPETSGNIRLQGLEPGVEYDMKTIFTDSVGNEKIVITPVVTQQIAQDSTTDQSPNITFRVVPFGSDVLLSWDRVIDNSEVVLTKSSLGFSPVPEVGKLVYSGVGQNFFLDEEAIISDKAVYYTLFVLKDENYVIQGQFVVYPPELPPQDNTIVDRINNIVNSHQTELVNNNLESDRYDKSWQLRYCDVEFQNCQSGDVIVVEKDNRNGIFITELTNRQFDEDEYNVVLEIQGGSAGVSQFIIMNFDSTNGNLFKASLYNQIQAGNYSLVINIYNMNGNKIFSSERELIIEPTFISDSSVGDINLESDKRFNNLSLWLLLIILTITAIAYFNFKR
jgi:hypothetical protein